MLSAGRVRASGWCRRQRHPFAAALALACISMAGALGLHAVAVDASHGRPVQSVAAADLLAMYARGAYQEVEAGLAAARDFARLQRDLERTSGASRSADPHAWRRRTTAAALALEAARAAFPTDPEAARALLEWGCTRHRQEGAAASAGERAWQVAALSLLQGVHDRELMAEHLRHAGPRFPADPHVDLARAWLIEAGTWQIVSRRPARRDVDEMKDRTDRVRVQGFAAHPAEVRAARLRELAGLLEPLVNDPDAAVDARLRLGHTRYRLGEYPRALEELRHIEELPAGPFARFLARLLTGRVLETMEEREGAIAAYRRALEIEPAAQSAAFALAGLLFVDDRRAEAAAVAAAALGADRARDPWRRYQTGTFHRWPELVAALRSSVRD